MRQIIKAGTYLSFIPGPRQSTFLYGTSLILAAWATNEPTWWISGSALLAISLCWQPIQKAIKALKQRYDVAFENALRLSVGMAAFTTIQIYSQSPAYAFLGRACAVLKKITTVAGSGTGSNDISRLIESTIYVVRGLFLVYLGIAVVNVIRQARQDEDWKTAAQTPMLAVVLIAAVEGISALVAPDAESGC